jgi:transcription initiation factor TFIIH subunit 2
MDLGSSGPRSAAGAGSSAATSATSDPTSGTGAGGHVWEESTNAWENAVQEDADGRIIVAGGETTADLIRRRRHRLELNDYAQRNRRVVRDMIRYVYVVIDASHMARTKDAVLPGGTKLQVCLDMLQSFTSEYYDQNPLSHLGFVVVKNGEAELLTKLSSSSKTHKVALQNFNSLTLTEGLKGGGEFSLQNGLDVAGRSLGHQPRHGSREIVILCSALSTCDPGHILTETLPRLKAANIRVSTFALSAEMHICRKIADETGGSMGVCLDKAHMRDWLMEQCVPPPALRNEILEHGCEMVRMGFPSREKSDVPRIVHATHDQKVLSSVAFKCPQCTAMIQELPSDCVVCGLKLVLSPHLARSFHHLFPVPPFTEVAPTTTTTTTQHDNLEDKSIKSSRTVVVSSMTKKTQQKPAIILDSKLRLSPSDEPTSCFACLRQIGAISKATADTEEQGEETLCFRCPNCRNVFCVNCDAFIHDSLHNCPGCLQKL